MTFSYSEYDNDEAIADFFTKTSAARSTCDARARGLVGGSAIPVEGQGNCSYSVYAGPDLEYVVQFRLKSLKLKTETTSLARKIFGALAPEVSFKGEMGDHIEGKEPLYVYVMRRMQGITHLDFILAHEFPDNSEEKVTWRKTFMVDIARFFAISWKTPLKVDSAYRDQLGQTYTKELRLLLSALPNRFHPIIEHCIRAMDDVLSLPMVLLHQDFSTCNIMVDETSCHLVGVIDWAEAEIYPFGLNLDSLQSFTGKLDIWNGWSRYQDYADLQDTFWNVFAQEVGGLTEDKIQAIKLARVVGLLLSHGFTGRLANEPPAVPIRDDDDGRYNMMSLDGLLINPATRFEDLD
ncbi:APH domain-containing protein [Trichoderma simmonsii]|uniref:APH domain-containing protein n=1 Tax=Trichoderma simmonsii TaxID=1491479 RepID=A0A8G0L7U4_9HYPO|nr:APH domain-containing protein [Trichoderma simmonsii]